MSLFEEFGNFFKTMRVYLLGRGFLSLLIFGATAAVGVGNPLVLGLVAAGGLAISAGMRLYSQRLYEDDMAELYREDIAQHLGMDPRAVTRTHLKAAAHDNEVIAQALARQRRINVVSFATSALAAAATFGMLYVGLAHNAVGDAIEGFFSKYFDGAATFARWTSIGIVSGISSLILHNGLEEAIGYGSGLSKAVAHDLIFDMHRDVRKGKTITPEQVYAVLVAENPELNTRIKREFGESYFGMKPMEQEHVLRVLNVREDMKEIASFITRREVPPGRLAYMMHYARPAKPREETAPTPAKDSSFVDRLNLAPREAMSHAERVDTSRTDLVLAR